MKKRTTIRKKVHIKRSKRSNGGAGAAGHPESRKKSKKPRKGPKIVKMTFNRGVQFEGRYLDEDETRMVGRFVNPKEGTTYQGTAVLNKRTSTPTVIFHGSGIVTQDNGETYEGRLCMGRKEGYGVYTLPNGSVYSGDFKNDIADGWGHLAELKDDGTFEHTTGEVIQQKDGTFSFLEDPMPPLDFAMGVHPRSDYIQVSATHAAYAVEKAKDASDFASLQAAARS